MSVSSLSTLSRFVHIYKGIEEFYFLNQAGELGYIKSGELRSVKETFPQLKDRGFLSSNPTFLRELEDFLRELGEISSAYLQTPPYDLELGYVLPAGDQHQWRSSTLVLHKHVLQALKADYEAMVKHGTKELVEAERDLGRIAGVRGIHQGLDELTYHRDAFGVYRYFPALFVLPEQSATEPSQPSKSSVRVINLRWRHGREESPVESQAESQIESEAESRAGHPAVHRRRDLVFSVLRESLTQRGAIDRSQRVENRFSIA